MDPGNAGAHPEASPVSSAAPAGNREHGVAIGRRFPTRPPSSPVRRPAALRDGREAGAPHGGKSRFPVANSSGEASGGLAVISIEAADEAPRAAKSKPGTAPMTSRSLVRTACPLDCPDACSLLVEVRDGRAARITAGPGNPATGGFICGKVAGFPRLAYGPGRIATPLIRNGPKGSASFRTASWEEAMEILSRRLIEVRDLHGGEAILPFHYGGSNGLLSDGTLDRRLFRRLGASRLARTVCAAAAGRAAEGLYGRMPGVPYGDYPHAGLIALWGVNPEVTGIHLVPPLKEARRRGAKLVVVDPRRTAAAASADIHLAVRPGTDLPVALAMHRHLERSGRLALPFLRAHATGYERLLEIADSWTPARAAGEAGVAEADLLRFADWYGSIDPAVIRCGWGVERNRNGGSAVAAILALPAVAGKFGKRGGGYTMSNSAAWKLDPSGAIAEPEPPARIVNMNRLGRTLIEAKPAVRFLFVYDSNPLSTLPEQNLVRKGLERTDLFTVVFDQALTDTARYADVVLPATTFLEHDELSRGYGAYIMHRSFPVAPPPGEARSNLQVFGELLDRLGLGRPGDPRTPDELVRAILDATPGGGRIAGELASGGSALPNCGTSFVQMADVLPGTCDGRIHLFPAALDEEAPAGLYRYQPDPGGPSHPFALISPASHRAVSSTLAGLDSGRAVVRIHPEDAEPLGIRDGAAVRISNRSGSAVLPAAVTREVRPGVLAVAKGLWARHTLDGNTSNALCPDSLADLGGGACFNDARVSIEPVAPPVREPPAGAGTPSPT